MKKTYIKGTLKIFFEEVDVMNKTYIEGTLKIFFEEYISRKVFAISFI